MNVKNLILGIAIIILTIFVVVYGFNSFYPISDYGDFCGEFVRPQVIETADECESLGGMWEDYSVRGYEGVQGHCNLHYYCSQRYNEASERHSLNRFLISIPLAIVIIILGAFFFKLDVVGAGLMGGGVGTLLFGIGGYWNYADNWFRFLISLVGLILIIWISYWFNQRVVFKEIFKKKRKSRKKRKGKKKGK